MKSYLPFLVVRIVVLSIILFSRCTKTYRENRPIFWGTIITPKNVTAGKPVISNVQVEYETTSFQVEFQGFQVKEISDQHFSISAFAIITSHGETTANDMLWKKDTTCVVQTGLGGRYIIDYMYRDSIQHSDTVIVR